MALDSTGLFTVIGKYVKAINTWNGYISTLESLKDEIFDKLEDEALQDLYVDLPSQFLGFKNAVTSWISTLISEVEDILLDEDYVTDELPIFQRDVTSVLNAIYDYMVDNSLTIKSSVVTLGGNDQDTGVLVVNSSTAATTAKGRVYLTRTLDGVSDPSSSVTAHLRYNGAESQLAMSCTHQARVISNSEGSEVVQLFCENDAQAPYGATAEKPGNGPTLTNVLANNVIPLNSDFSSVASNTPTGWTVTGGVHTTDWACSTIGTGIATGVNVFTIKTDEVTARQQLTGLTRYQRYFFAVSMFPGNIADLNDNATIVVTIEDVAGGAYATSTTATVTDDWSDDFTFESTDYHDVCYGFFTLGEEDDLNDVYIKIRMATQSDTDLWVNITQAVVAPVTYYNGLGHAFFSPVVVPEVNDNGSIAIANNNGGVFQTFFRRAYDIQLPTADSPTIADSLAT